jgi:hypothetical protein
MDESTVNQSRATWTHDLSQSERRFLAAMNEINFGRFELLSIRRGELVLDPWPKTVRAVRFGPQDPLVHKQFQNSFELRPPVIEFFDYVRGVDEGEILCLSVRWGLPFLMEIMYRPE